MTNPSHQNSVALALAVTTPCLAGLWLISVPHTIAPSTSTIAMALLVAAVGTTVSLSRSACGINSMGQLLRAMQMVPSAAESRPVSRSATRSGS